MMRSHVLLAAVAAAAMTGSIATASAAPAGGMTAPGEALKTDAQSTGNVENVRYVCWRNDWGRRVCGWQRPRVYGFYYGAPRRWGYYGYRGWNRGWRRGW